MASSLPPSSPPSTSSRAVDVARHDEGPAFEDPCAFQYVDLDVSTASDPFGFFAVEKKLKILREQSRPMYQSATLPDDSDHDSIEDLYADDPDTDAPVVVFPTPRPQRPALDLTGHILPLNPLTPHKNKHRHPDQLKRKPTTSPSRSSTVPSTPSPSKPVNRTRAAAADPNCTTGDHDRNANAGKENIPASDRKKTRGVKKARASTLDPRELAKGLESLLPRRPKRKIKGARVGKARNVKSKATIVDSSDEEAKLVKGAEKSVTAKRKQPIKNTARKAKKVAGAGTGKVKEEEKNHASEDGEDEDEKWANERQARLEYFRKLDQYVVEKENVYVI